MCRRVFDVGLRCIVHLRLHKVKNLMSKKIQRSALSVIGVKAHFKLVWAKRSRTILQFILND